MATTDSRKQMLKNVPVAHAPKKHYKKLHISSVLPANAVQRICYFAERTMFYGLH